LEDTEISTVELEVIVVPVIEYCTNPFGPVPELWRTFKITQVEPMQAWILQVESSSVW
jgi:hypothetical protein